MTTKDFLIISHGLRFILGQECDQNLIDHRLLALKINGIDPIDYMINNLEIKTRNAYDSQTAIKKLRILMATNEFNIINRIIFGYRFPEILEFENHDILGRLLKNIVDIIRPYNDDDTLKIRIKKFLEIGNQYLNKLNEIIERFKKRTFVEFYEFNIIGCPTSTDIDVVARVNRDEIDKEIDISKLRTLIRLAGYNTDERELDVNLIAINENGDLEWAEKGGMADTQNIIFETYKHHKQIHPCLVKRIVPIDIYNKVNATAKFILDNMKVLIGKPNYSLERQRRRAVYSSTEERLTYSLYVADLIQYQNSKNWLSCIKSLVMKIIQLIELDRDEPVVYIKEELVNDINRIYPETKNYASWLLFRGQKGEYNYDFLKTLLQEYKLIALNNKKTDLKWTKLSLDLNINPTDLPNLVIREFIKSPSEPTELFIREFELLCPSRNTNNVFHIHCMNTELLPDELIKKHCVIVDQRTDEWINLLKYYLCGKNTGVIPYEGLDWVKFYYNLIRGSIMELFAIKTCDFSTIIGDEYDRITIGFLAEDKNKQGSPAIAPDLLLKLKSGVIVPVEFKCIEGKMADNHHYRRAVSLASRQLATTAKILKTDIGIIVLIYVNINNGIVMYDTYGTIININ